ncbi:unnamed protein product [Effrenium voratum]|nr:unnamed protein product [Effrenium voratum]
MGAQAMAGKRHDDTQRSIADAQLATTSRKSNAARALFTTRVAFATSSNCQPKGILSASPFQVAEIMAPTNRAQMKGRHLTWAIACDKERAVQLGELPPLPKLPPVDAKSYRSEYFPIGGRNATNNNSRSAVSALGTSSWAGSGGLRSTYRSTIGAPTGPLALGFVSGGIPAQMAVLKDVKAFYSIPETAPRLTSYSRTLSAPALQP